MTLSLPSSGRLAVLASAVLYTGLTFGAATSSTPAFASDGPYYTAQLAQPTEERRTVAGGVAWACQGTTCVANKGTSRPSRVCRGLMRELGEVTDFTADGETLEEEKLENCNGN
jgi:hypothetical protein